MFVFRNVYILACKFLCNIYRFSFLIVKPHPNKHCFGLKFLCIRLYFFLWFFLLFDVFGCLLPSCGFVCCYFFAHKLWCIFVGYEKRNTNKNTSTPNIIITRDGVDIYKHKCITCACAALKSNSPNCSLVFGTIWFQNL